MACLIWSFLQTETVYSVFYLLPFICVHTFDVFFSIFLLGDQTVNNKNAGKDWEKCIKILAKISSQKRYVTNGCPTLTDNRTVLLVKQTHTSQVRMFIKQAQYFHTSWLFGWTNKRWVLYGFDVCFSSHSEK